MSFDQIIRVNDSEFSVRLTGQGVPFIWAHGMLSSMHTEDAWGIMPFECISKHCQLIRYDARGHGQSQQTTDPKYYQWTLLADDLLAIAEALNLKEFIVGGASMGCSTAIYAALKAPEKIKALILRTPPTAWQARQVRS